MLAYILAIAVALASLGLYLAAFLLPEVHRKYDLLWSGVGLFYALVLWVCAGRITGGVLLGQIASVSLIGWFGWQTLQLRFAEGESSRPGERVAVKPFPDAATNPDSLVATVRSRIAQYRQRLRQNSDTSSILLNLDRLIEGIVQAFDRLRIWLSALMSTAISEAESPDPLTQPAESSASASRSPAPTIQPPEVIETSRPEVATVRIEVESVSIESPAAETPEPAAEWGDLEFDNDPDMETIDGSMESVSDALKRAGSRRSEGDRA
ncbi:Ycf66 family protein [Leptolyngbya ohadii]|uniref:Ycf66 family protein n=1 Tax=Leptolyngbya ohadii TaxID=1962290 RepID=UPI000B59A80A|nr:Ycf66 family protein [Leptolyngbya ohadii]